MLPILKDFGLSQNELDYGQIMDCNPGTKSTFR